jgi:hypothetical protein
MNDYELMGIRADTLFVRDSRGRLLRSNEPDGRPAPRLFLGRTAAGDVVRFGETLPDALARELAEIVARQPAAADLRVPPALLVALRAVLEWHAPVVEEGGGPAYRFPASLAPPDEVVQVTQGNLALVRDTFPWLERELPDWQPCFAVVRDSAAVSVCFSSRNGAAAAEAGLETLPAFRGRGYAAAVTAAWGAAIRSGGRIPLYSTAWDNIASQRVAQRVGLILFGSDMSWT